MRSIIFFIDFNLVCCLLSYTSLFSQLLGFNLTTAAENEAMKIVPEFNQTDSERYDDEAFSIANSSREFSCIVHCAAVVDWMRPYSSLRGVNVFGAFVIDTR
jgi:hypothetical protein